MCLKRSHDVIQPFASFLLSLFVCSELFCVAPGNACAGPFSVRAFIVRLMCYHRMSLYSSSRAIVFHVAVGKAGGGQSSLVALTYVGRSSTTFCLYNDTLGKARYFPGFS